MESDSLVSGNHHKYSEFNNSFLKCFYSPPGIKTPNHKYFHNKRKCESGAIDFVKQMVYVAVSDIQKKMKGLS